MSAANARQHHAGLRAGEGTDRHTGRLDTDGRPRAGRVRRRRHARVGLRATVERVGPARADDEHGRRSLVPRIEDYARRDPGQQHQSVDRGTTDNSARTLLTRVPNPYFGIIPRSSSIGDPTITRAQLMKPFPAYTAVSLYRNNVGTTQLPGRRVQHSSATVTRPDLLGRLHPFEADGHRLVGVRRVDSDRAADERRRRRQPQSGARSRLLDRRHSALLRRLGRVGSSVGRGPCQAAERRGRRARERLERRDAS